jgi:FixJ family two-component response regulator
VSEITIKVHHRRIMEKMQVRSLAQLVLMVEKLS